METEAELREMGLPLTAECDALVKAWKPIPPRPHPGSIGILLRSVKAMRDELLARVEELTEQRDYAVGQLNIERAERNTAAERIRAEKQRADELEEKVKQLDARLLDTAELYECQKQRADEAEAALANARKRVEATEDEWRRRANEQRGILAKREQHIEDCHRNVERLEAKLAATEAQVARAEWKLKRLRDEGVIKDDDLASLEAVFVEFHREAQS